MGKITAANLHTKTDKEILEEIACFGRMFNPQEDLCVGCMAKARCLHSLAMVTLPQEALERGAYDANHETGKLYAKPESLDLNEVAREMQTEVPVLQYALQYATNPKMGLPVLQADGTLIPSMLGPPQIGGQEPPAIPPAENLDEVLDATEEDEPAEEIEEEEPVQKPAKKKATSKKKPAKKTTKKAPEKKAKVKKVPQKALSKPSGEQDVGQARFEREIERLGLSELPLGTVIEKKQRGSDVIHKVKLLKQGWEYNGEIFPTLYATQMAITGGTQYPAQIADDGSRPDKTRKMASMSASRFFNLEKVLENAMPPKKGRKKA